VTERSPEDDAIISEIFEAEGGDKFTNDPADAGGPTKFGITLGALQLWRGHNPPVTAEDVRNLQEPEAREIAYMNYIVKPGFARINDPKLRYALVDFTYLFGPDDSIPALQEIVGTAADGQLGPKTAAAANAMEPRAIINRLAVKRERLHVARVISELRKLPNFNELQARFLKGWSNRALSFIT